MLNTFRPIPSLRSGHTQSFLAGLKLRRWVKKLAGSAMHRRAKPITLSSEHGTLMGMVSRQAAENEGCDWVVMIHGWEGSHDSVYLFCLADTLYRQGYNVMRLNLRDHGETYHLNQEPFHAARLPEVAAAIAKFQSLVKPNSLSLVGYSMGGNFALRCGIAAKEFGLDIHQIVAVSPPINPQNTMNAIDAIGGYRRYFVKKWHKSIKAKQREFPERYQFNDALRLKTLDDLLEYFIDAKLIPFPQKKDYLSAYGISAQDFSKLEIPSLIITAKDDPVIPVEDFYVLEAQQNNTPYLQLHISEYGGHCGYIENMRLTSVLEPLILRSLPSIKRGG